jgi:hypothetical protein
MRHDDLKDMQCFKEYSKGEVKAETNNLRHTSSHIKYYYLMHKVPVNLKLRSKRNNLMFGSIELLHIRQWYQQATILLLKHIYICIAC